ncbi:hypothetical protein D9758_015914 [Tetrapyrgos nigripes]|uniref:RING-type domain-containing protein n=1 Tax=Tetrapyrgos nigripes TaxID=182062 RepID=A0A8H5FN82_9AGAR|nr:hypothetical protein D9758_015914 [Tetrapyrgos nigripes]
MWASTNHDQRTFSYLHSLHLLVRINRFPLYFLNIVMDHDPTSLSQPTVHKSKFRPSTDALRNAARAHNLALRPNPTKQRKEKEKQPIKVIELSDDELPSSRTKKPRNCYEQMAAELQEMLRKALEKQTKLEEENAQLKNELSTYQAMIYLNADDVKGYIVCDVCASTMWSPFILTGCGHTFCDECLDNWFKEILKKWKERNPTMSL